MKPSKEARREAINAGQWSKPNVIHKSEKDYDRQREKRKARKEIENEDTLGKGWGVI